MFLAPVLFSSWMMGRPLKKKIVGNWPFLFFNMLNSDDRGIKYYFRISSFFFFSWMMGRFLKQKKIVGMAIRRMVQQSFDAK